jgi:hypothetical protein
MRCAGRRGNSLAMALRGYCQSVAAVARVQGEAAGGRRSEQACACGYDEGAGVELAERPLIGKECTLETSAICCTAGTIRQ